MNAPTTELSSALRDALTQLLLRLADNDLILGHRNSEWTGLGPILEEDIAFASMAQDQLGHAQAYYLLLAHLHPADAAYANPDRLAFHRSARAFCSSHLVELPISGFGPAGEADYAFSLMRHWLYETAKALRLGHLARQTAWPPLAELATKITREHRYHQLHASTWISQLGRGSDESRLRMQSALNESAPAALALFEASEGEAALVAAGVQPSEAELAAAWQASCAETATAAGLTWPAAIDPTPYLGGAAGWHTDHLDALLREMTEVTALDPTARW